MRSREKHDHLSSSFTDLMSSLVVIFILLFLCQGRSKTLPVWRSKSRPVDKQEVEGFAGSVASGA